MGYPTMFYISEENRSKLTTIGNKSELVNKLLQEYFYNNAVDENLISKQDLTIKELSEKLNREKEQREKIILKVQEVETTKQREAELEAEEILRIKQARETEEEYKKAREEQALNELLKINPEATDIQKNLWLYYTNMNLSKEKLIKEWEAQQNIQ
jgi:hypothetical protein